MHPLRYTEMTGAPAASSCVYKRPSLTTFGKHFSKTMDSPLSITFPQPHIALVKVVAQPRGAKAGTSPADDDHPSSLWKDLHRFVTSFSTNAELDVVVLVISGKANSRLTKSLRLANTVETSVQKTQRECCRLIQKCTKRKQWKWKLPGKPPWWSSHGLGG